MLISHRVWRKTKLQTRIFTLTLAVTFVSLMAIANFSTQTLGDALQNQVGKRSAEVAETIAYMPAVINSVQTKNKPLLINLIQPLKKKLGAAYIIILNNEAPESDAFFRVNFGDPGSVTQHLVRDSEQTHITFSEDILGPSMLAQAPILNYQGKVIGSVVVDFLESDIEKDIDNYTDQIIILLILVLIICALTAKYIAAGVKRAILGLEPQQIATLFVEMDAVIESVREAIITLDRQGQITKINQRALNLLALNDQNNSAIVQQFLNKEPLKQALQGHEPVWDCAVNFGDKPLLVTVTPLLIKTQFSGHVVSFRQKDELEELSRELSKTQHYSELLRAQTHEHANKLHTIYGLLQANLVQEAMALISQVSEDHQTLISLLMRTVKNPVLAGLLIGKYNRAKELGLHLEVDPDSSMAYQGNEAMFSAICTILGNLIDNAMEASLRAEQPELRVGLSMTDLGHELIFEIEDTGPGFPAEQRQHAFNKGVSSKTEAGHGFGLYLVKTALDQVKGHIEIDNNAPSGTIITVYIPKDPSHA